MDVWAAGIVLFIMIVGLPPFEWASSDDPRYRLISRGGLDKLVCQWQRPISTEAIDLLQRMLKEDPRERLSLFEVMHHPWVTEESVNPKDSQQADHWRT